MAAAPDIRVNVTFEIMQQSYLEVRDVYAVTLADMILWKNVAQDQAMTIARLEAENALLRLQINPPAEENAAPPAQPPD